MNAKYGLSDQEVKAISVAEFFPLENVSKLASASHMKSTALATSLRRLKDRGSMKQRAVFNPFSVGLIPVAVYGQLLERDPEHKRALIERMEAAGNVTYIFETLGQYNFFFSILVPSLNRIPCIMGDLFEKQGDVFSAKLVAPRLELTLFPKKFLGVGSKDGPQIIIAPRENECNYIIDELDSGILNQLCNVGFESIRQIAKTIDEPASTVERRIHRLVGRNVIAGFRYSIDRATLKTHHARLLVSKKGFCGKTNDRIMEFCSRHKNVVRLTRAVGAWDYEVSVEVEELSEISCIVNGFHELCGVRLAHIEVVTDLGLILERPFITLF